MSKNKEAKIIPSLPVDKQNLETKTPNYAPWLVMLVVIFFALVLLVSFLPLQGYMKVLSLFLGAFLIFDIHHSIKYHVKSK